MKAPSETSRLLDRGGRPTVRELLASLVFNPADGTIRLNGDRLVMQRAAVGVQLRRELIGLLGHDEARIFLMRLGYLSGRADARFTRVGWPNLDIGDAFTAGTRLHTFSGVVRVETVYNDFDFRKKRFAGEFLWHDSVEAAGYQDGPRTSEPVCWTQLGYASGYASEFFDTLVIYKEIECSAQGHAHCRVIGKPAEAWAGDDPDVAVFRERIAPASSARRSRSSAAAARSTGDGAASALDRLILSPVQAELDRVTGMSLPVLISGAPGTGRGQAAHYLHRASRRGGELRRVYGRLLDFEDCAEISGRRKPGRRNAGAQTIVIDAVQEVPRGIQRHLAAAIEEGATAGGARILALLDDAQSDGTAEPLCADLRHTLSIARIRLPVLDEREGQRAALARALLPTLAAAMRIEPPNLDAEAARAIEMERWPGNLRQLRAVLGAALLADPHSRSISRAAIEAQLSDAAGRSGGSASVPSLAARFLDQMIDEGGVPLSAVEEEVYAAAVKRTGGNLSAAARLLGLTRPQLAYRLGARRP